MSTRTHGAGARPSARRGAHSRAKAIAQKRLGRQRDSAPDAPRPPPALADDAHKGDAGRVLAICGSRDMPGAAVLVARSAQRAGAGLVTLGYVAPSLRTIVPAGAPEAVLLDLTRSGSKGERAWNSALRARDDHARIVGPGLGASTSTRRLVQRLVADAFEGPLVLDADALNVLAGDLESLRARNGVTVLTPHPGEAQRLLEREIPRDSAGRVRAAIELSRRSGAIACLKGHRTVVADGERVYVNSTGNPGMATAGAGDVLSGVLVAYLALCSIRKDPKWSAFDAVAAGVHVHGLAGDLAAEDLGRRGLIASDLVQHLAAAQRRFEAARS
jgi:hydroxyethylthiazole kinase-like uncharacterized protein yjeF